MRWVLVIIYTLCIYAFLPVSPHFWDFMKRSHPVFLNLMVRGIIPAGIFIFLFYFVFILRKRGVLSYIYSGILLLSYYILIKLFCRYPAEVFHSIEYGIMVIFLYHAMKDRRNDTIIYATIIVYTLMAGSLDEFIQLFLPDRVYEFRDMAINWISGLLATGLLMVVTMDRQSTDAFKDRVKEPEAKQSTI